MDGRGEAPGRDDPSDHISQQQTDLTPEGYARLVQAYSRQSAAESLYAGVHYEDLAKYLISPYRSNAPYASPTQASRSGDTTPSSEEFLLACDLELRGKNRTVRIGNCDELDARLESSSSKSSSGQIFFMRGFATPRWLNHIGAKLRVDPEFYYRHLDILSSSPFGVKDYTCIPQLPSSGGILQLRVITLGTWDMPRTNLSLSDLRKQCTASMVNYRNDFSATQSVPVTHPIVRNFKVHDEHHFSLEQTISITVTRHRQNWISLVWTDAGSSLLSTTKGPWIESRDRLFWGTNLHPVFQHRSRVALKPTKSGTEMDSGVIGTRAPLIESAHQLPIDYGRFLHPETMEYDAFYALNEVFAFAAASKSQFLNLMEQSIHALSCSGSEENIAELQLIKANIEDHLQALRDELRGVKARGFAKWPSIQEKGLTNKSSASQLDIKRLEKKAEDAAAQLQKDFEYLVHRAATLSGRCSDAIGVMLTQSNYHQTKRTNEQAERLGKLTLLAFFFVPLSFTCSFFGMNFVELGQGKLSIWMWFAVSVPVLLISFSAWFSGNIASAIRRLR